MGRNLLIFGVLLVILIAVAFFTLSGRVQQLRGGSQKTANVNGHTFQLEIADSSEKREAGLSKRNSLPENTGMLFLFEEPGVHQFWMKDMQIPIDIIFLNGERVVTVYQNVQPFLGEGNEKRPNLTLYPPTSPANRVLEINAGLSEKYNVQVGDEIQINL